jgi:hypothetical protein
MSRLQQCRDAYDELLLEMVAAHMRQIDPRSARGAPVLVGDLRRALHRMFPNKEEFDAAFVRLERTNRLILVRHDAAMAGDSGDTTTLIFDGSMHYCGVALR